ncbi:MAG: SusC/RagA family TonB-linked outer membrane protein [Bacteroidota bacterium]
MINSNSLFRIVTRNITWFSLKSDKSYSFLANTLRQLFWILLVTAFTFSNVNAQQVSGRVTSELDGQGLPGVTIMIKGTQKGAVTNFDGDYSIEVDDENSILVFRYVGFETQEIRVGTQTTINVTLNESAETLGEVVVTALGITRKEASLGYSVGQVSGEDMTKVTQENVVNSLAGKVSGVTINSTGGTGTSVSVVIRGATSLSNDNQPLFVVDGVPVINSLKNNTSQIGENNVVDYGNPISDINPDDIESVSVLKGPSAAALYGSRAGNGVILITTKTGKGTKGMTVNVSLNTVVDRPYKYFGIQRHFSSGFFPFTPDDFPPNETPEISPIGGGVGMETDKGYYAIQWHSPTNALGGKVPIEVVSYPDNVANFVQNGITSTNSVSVMNSKDDMNFRLGVTNMSSRGITPGSDLYRNNFSFAGSIKAHERVTISSNLNISRSYSNNRPSSSKKGSPIYWVYKTPLNINILDLNRFNEEQYAHLSEIPDHAAYWKPGQEGVQQRTPANGTYNNPYFLAHEIKNSFVRDRVFGNLKGEIQITPELSLMGRYSLDMYNEIRESKIPPSYLYELNNGSYGIISSKNFESNADFLATYNKQINDFNIGVSAGGNISYRKGSMINNSATDGLVVPHVYSVRNIKSGSLYYNSTWYQRGIYSLYGMANLAYNEMIYLDLTARNDWSSTLPAENRSYFYPSASLSVLLNELIDLGNSVNLLKLRGGWARVGNDTDPYKLTQVYNNDGQWGEATRLSKSGDLLTPDLKPEIATSMEFGTDIRVFNDRLRFEGTWYTLDNENQIIKVGLTPSSGYNSVFLNAGLIRSQGWEFMVQGTPISNDLTWDIGVNFSRNRTTLVEIAEGIDFIEFWTGAKGGARTYKGDQIGDIYEESTLLRVEDPNSPYYGYPIVDKFLEGNSRWKTDPQKDVYSTKIGNFNPDFLMGLQTTLSYKNFTLSMVFDWRKGGQFISQTHRYMSEDKNAQDWLDQLIHPGGREGQELRDWLVANADEYITDGFNVVGGPTPEYGGFYETYAHIYDGVFIPGVTQNEDGTYNENLGGPGTVFIPYIIAYPWSFASPSTFDADFIKLREVSLSYQFPQSITDRMKLQNLHISVYSRNIMLWTKAKIAVDPERAFEAQSSGFRQGIENFNLEPWVIPVGLKLNLTF